MVTAFSRSNADAMATQAAVNVEVWESRIHSAVILCRDRIHVNSVETELDMMIPIHVNTEFVVESRS